LAKTALASPAPSRHLRLATFLHAVLFVLGFSIVFVVGWGGTATALGQLFGAYKPVLGHIGGVAVIIFGLATLRWIKIPWLYYGTRPQWNVHRRGGWLASLFMGVFFAAGWTPCIGTTLGAILTLGFSQQTAGQAMVLSSGYALGLGAPFLAIGLAMNRATDIVRRLRRHLRIMEIVSGLFLILMGIYCNSHITEQRDTSYLPGGCGCAGVDRKPSVR